MILTSNFQLYISRQKRTTIGSHLALHVTMAGIKQQSAPLPPAPLDMSRKLGDLLCIPSPYTGTESKDQGAKNNG